MDLKASIYSLCAYQHNIMKEKIFQLEKKIQSQHSIADNLSFFANESKWEDILIEMNSHPFFQGKKLIKIYHFQLYPLEILLDYIKNPSSFIILILISYEETKKISVKWMASLKKYANLDIAQNLYKNQLKYLVIKALASYHWNYNDDILDYLLLQVDGKKENIKAIINKLAINYPKNAILEKEMLFFLLKRDFEISPFEFMEAFFSKNIALMLNYFFLFPEDFSYSSLIFLFFRQIRLISYYKQKKIEGHLEDEIFQALGIMRFVGKKIQKQAEQWSLEAMEKLYQQLYECLLNFKAYSGQLEKKYHKDLFQSYLCSCLS